MLIRTLLYTNTLPNRKDEEFVNFDNVKRRQKTKDETALIESTEERRKLIFKTTCVSSQYKKREERAPP